MVKLHTKIILCILIEPRRQSELLEIEHESAWKVSDPTLAHRCNVRILNHFSSFKLLESAEEGIHSEAEYFYPSCENPISCMHEVTRWYIAAKIQKLLMRHLSKSCTLVDFSPPCLFLA
ncbi:hypothetical protein ABG067_006445 [Albugo candida]|uniref:Uncharacterized protein n=1 Tax=Albugo candida TaxID=65357 RepID=A0A024G762_9STRA|nr:unnamed protein product [Albugo candida]|eukprot:CCI42161.1 unnamed protein product [Albugo candida]